MEDKDKQIETLKNELKSSRESWFRTFEETENLKAELLLYKKLCKSQSEIINSK